MCPTAPYILPALAFASIGRPAHLVLVWYDQGDLIASLVQSWGSHNHRILGRVPYVDWREPVSSMCGE